MSVVSRSLRQLAVLVLLLTAPCVTALALTRNWNAGGDQTNWFDAVNWDTGVPVAGDAAVIDGTSTVLLTNSTAALSSFTITNATVTFTNWTTMINATSITIQSGGSLTHVLCDTNAAISNTNRIYILCSNLTIMAGGSINVDEMGYLGGAQASEGCGPGGGNVASLSGGGGGRIAIEYDPTAQAALPSQPTMTFSVMHATAYQTADLTAGTVYFPDNTILPDTPTTMLLTKAYVYGVDAWTLNDLTVNNGLVHFMEPGFQCVVSNKILVTGSGGSLHFDIANQIFAVGGDIAVTNG